MNVNFSVFVICVEAIICLLFYNFHDRPKGKSVFSKSDDITSPHSLLYDVTMLSVLIENVVLVFPQEKLSFINVSIPVFELKTRKQVLEVPMIL